MNDDGQWRVDQQGTWVHPSRGAWRYVDGQWRQLTARPKGLGCGLWLVMLALACITAAGCYVLPQISWTGWGIILAIYFVGRSINSRFDYIESKMRRDDD